MTSSTTLFKKISISIAKVGQFWQESLNGSIFRWNLVIILVQFGFVWYRYFDLPPEIPLFFSRPWGSERLASSTSAFLLPVLSAIVLVTNNLLAVFMLHSNSLLSKLLIITSLVFSLLSFIAIFQSIRLVV